MRPLRLLLDGFGTYRNETEIDFADVDFFALVGPTGSGKSTVIDALCFALYGTVPRWDNEKEVRNALAPSANACNVTLIFELSGERYVAVRSLQRDKRGNVTTKAARLERLDASIPADSPLAELLEASAEQTGRGPWTTSRPRVQDILGLSYEHFTQSVLLPQGRFSEFPRATPANRQRLLVELLAFGVYKDIGQRASGERAQSDAEQPPRSSPSQARDQLADATEEAESARGRPASPISDRRSPRDRRQEALADADRVAISTRGRHGQRRDQQQGTRPPASPPFAPRRKSRAWPSRSPRPTPWSPPLASAATTAAQAAEANGRSKRARCSPDKAETQRQLERYGLRRELVAEAEFQATALVTCREKEDKLAAELQAADLAVAVAQDSLEAAQRAHAVAGLAETLHVGDDCPVCRQQVQVLPPHHAPADLSAARTMLDTASKAQRLARTAHQDAAKAAAAASSALAATQARLDKAALVMADSPSEDSLTRLLDSIAAADETVGKTRTQAASRQTELAAAERSRDALAAAEQHAWAQLSSTRDTLVPFGALGHRSTRRRSRISPPRGRRSAAGSRPSEAAGRSQLPCRNFSRPPRG